MLVQGATQKCLEHLSIAIRKKHMKTVASLFCTVTA